MNKADGRLTLVNKDDLKLLETNPEEFWSGVTSIGNSAFMNMSDLKSITIPEGVTSIGNSAFSFCINLENVNIPKTVTSIGDHAFSVCRRLFKVSIPGGVKEIKEGAFFDACNIFELKLEKGIEYIGKDAFNGVYMKEVTIPSSVISIGESAFANCPHLNKVNIKKGVQNIEHSAFNCCGKLENITIPSSVTSIGEYAFSRCEKLTNVVIEEGVKNIESSAFSDCHNLESITIPKSIENIDEYAFSRCESLTTVKVPQTIKNLSRYAFNTTIDEIYLNKEEIVLTSGNNKEFQKGYYKFDYFNDRDILDLNYRTNFLQVNAWKEQNKVKFVPPAYTLKIFPSNRMELYFLNKNSARWGEIVKASGFGKLPEENKEDMLSALMKIYYALGGFSTNQGESEKARDYILKYVLNPSQKHFDVKEVSNEIYEKFKRIKLRDDYNKEFAKFFMRYYKDDKNFMVFELPDKDGYTQQKMDYLPLAHNSFALIQKNYPNKVVGGNTEYNMFSPRFVAEHCVLVEYTDIRPGNEQLAELIGKYGYSQAQFERIQNIYERAKTIKDSYVIMADRADENDTVKFRILEKDDKLGFILGDITNCCQKFGGAAESCIEDAFTNPEAGFLVFEESIKDKNGKDTGEVRMLGQAYVWYDPVTKTVCLDNIEIPGKVLNELRKEGKSEGKKLSKEFMDAVEKSAVSIMKAMNKNGIKVERVTTGEGRNDLKHELEGRYQIELKPLSQHREYDGYSDAREKQYIIKTYDEVTKDYAAQTLGFIDEIKSNLEKIQQEENAAIV